MYLIFVLLFSGTIKGHEKGVRFSCHGTFEVSILLRIVN